MSSERPVSTLSGLLATTASPLCARPRHRALTSSQFGRRSRAALPPIRTNAQLPCNFSPCSSNLSMPWHRPRRVGILRGPISAVPQQHRAAAVLSFGMTPRTRHNRAGGPRPRPAASRRGRGSVPRNRPALQHPSARGENHSAAARGVLWMTKESGAAASCAPAIARRFGRFPEIAFAAILFERHAAGYSAATAVFSCGLSSRRRGRTSLAKRVMLATVSAWSRNPPCPNISRLPKPPTLSWSSLI